MKTLSILKRLITVYYYLMIVSLLASVFGVFVFLITRNSKMTPKILGVEVDFNELSMSNVFVVILLIGVLYFVYLKAIYLLKKSLPDLSSGNYFSVLIIKNFNLVGKLFLICCLVELIGKIILRLLVSQKLSMGLDSSLFMFFIMGLFFMFLSEVFAKAKKIKEENDLTI